MGSYAADGSRPRHAQDPIAIIGMACRLPGDSNSPSSLWNFLENGRCAVTSAPASRFRLKGHFDGSRKRNTLKSPGAMFCENVDLSEFDARFFGISVQEAIAMDPQQRQLLEVVYECLENAGVTLPSLEGAPVGCFVASSTSDYRDIHARDPEDRPANATVGLVPAILANRISHFFDLRGPSMTIDTACSASLTSLDVANKYLQAGEINSAIVAGVHLFLSPEANMDHGAMREAFSTTGKCHTFDAKADGYMKAEGTNAVLLKRLDDAIRDRDPIRAVIRGTATNSDGKTVGIANPSAESQAAAIEAAYKNAGIANIVDTTYLECHGTGTLAGDPVELQAASSVLCKGRSSTPLMVGSIKSNIGHSECSAGISGLIKTVLALERGSIPGNPTFVTPNPNIDFKGLKVQASQVARPWPQGVLRRASVNSFGFGGSNAHVVVEEAKSWAEATHVSSLQHSEALDDFFAEDDNSVGEAPTLLIFSANDEQALKSSVEALKRHVMNPVVKVSLRDLAYTLSERRTLHFYRGFVTTDKPSFDSTALVSGKKSAKMPRVGYVFTGQGAQWPEMGKPLVQCFPEVEKTLRYLDTVLQRSLIPPPWSLVDELCEPRSAAHLRQPALSQPLVTAIQIALVDLFQSWGINPHAVVGHSSGEIAAAYCAGRLSIENAIKIAYYRGQASTTDPEEDEPAQGMLATGLGRPEVSKYIEGSEPPVAIACYNSAKSTTLSGTAEALAAIQTRLEADSHFARMLHVDVAYHSQYISGKADAYKILLEKDCQAAPFSKGDVRMFSTVTGRELGQVTDAEYWQTNMTSPVRFDDAVREMTASSADVDFLVEIGPSGALAGPIAQILAMSPEQGSKIQYCAALKRGQEDLQSLFGVAGCLFIAGYNIDMRKVNQQDDEAPRAIVDLPNYAWNHATQYWHESEASRDWRFRLFPPHDLIGSKILGTTWHTPVWKIDLDVNNVPWLKDHKLGTDIVIPGAAMMVMAVEAMSQRVEALRLLENKSTPRHPCYRVRNVTFTRALVLQEGKRQTIETELRARSGSKDGWYEVIIRSLVNGTWFENSRGLVRVEETRQDLASKEVLKPFVNNTPGVLWYQAMEDVGYALGPAFQNHLKAESLSGSRNSRSILSLTAPPTKISQTRYLMHPTTVDTILQACAPALWAGNRTNINAVIIPAMIDEAVLCRQPSSASTGMLVASSSYSGLGDPSQTRNYTADANVYDTDTGALLFKLSRLRTNVLNTRALDYKDPVYCRLLWRPDVTFLSSRTPADSGQPNGATEHEDWRAISEVLELSSFKKPDQDILESVLVPSDSTSVWLDHVSDSPSSVASCGSYHLVHVDAKALLETQAQYPSHNTTAFSLHDLSSTPFGGTATEPKFDLVIARVPSSSREMFQTIARNIREMLREGGQLLLLENRDQESDHHTDASAVLHSNADTPSNLDGFTNARHIPLSSSPLAQNAWILTREKVMDTKDALSPSSRAVHLLHFLPLSSPAHHVIDGLKNVGWTITTHSFPFKDIADEVTILILDDLTSPLLSTISERHWNTLQALFTSQRKILWLTQGSQFEVSTPENAQIHGLVRTIRDEDPSVKITTLDLEDVLGQHTISSVANVLEHVHTAAFQKTGDYEYADVGGVIHISRVLQDDVMNKFTREERDGSELCSKPFYDKKSKLQVVCERVGNLDSLVFHEIDAAEPGLQENEVMIEIAATGLNYKDIVISTGLIPGNERLLGFEGAGIIVQSNSASYSIGQRVCFTRPGALANRITVPADLVHPIPDSMSFEQAATVGAVFPVSLYSLFDLAHIGERHRVLVHSAAGGVGIACIQICQAVGAEVFATVGNQQKRQFLTKNFGIDPSRIFNSRSVEFAPQLLNATNGEGVDVIVNSLTGDLLEESWNCIREGGTMIELGKRDINERNFLPMEPFSRNVSYQSFDISHKSVPNSVMKRLLTQTFDMISEGRLKPISPIEVFSPEDVTAAFRFMRDGKHMGKIVVSSGSQRDIRVPVRPALQSMRLRGDVSYLIVGGLKGLCGSIALTFARHGAKSLIVMGRSGFDDNASQTVIRNIEAEGCKVHLVKGDVIVKEDVQRAFKSAALPVGGVVQGAMAVRGKLYRAMSAADYHYGVNCKVRGTWNLHDIALEHNLKLDFFTLLSSTSGVAGQSGQANYVAANAFLDAFAIYRRRLGLRANSIALGPMWDVGYMSRNKGDLPATNVSTFTTISERLFLKIIEYSVLQQVDPINEASAAHLITGMAIPLQESSTLRTDARFAALFGAAAGNARAASKEANKELDAFKLLSTSKAGEKEIVNALVELVSRQLGTVLQLNEPMEPAIAPSNYGMESLAAVELRNWVRMELQADVTILEILNASSLITLCEKIWEKIQK